VKRLLVALLLLPLCAWLAAWAAASAMRRRSAAAEWPERLGTIEAVPARFPDADTSSAALKLMNMAAPLGVDFTSPKMHSHISRAPFDAIKAALQHPLQDAPSPILRQYFEAHRAELDDIREHILTGGPIRWSMRIREGEAAPVPNLLGHLNLSKLFTARAIATGSWDDLHAVWVLNRNLWDRPELMCGLIALAGSRMVNGAAGAMPLPTPAWFSEVQSLDYRHRFAVCYQFEAWSHRRICDDLIAEHRVWSPFIDLCAADSVEAMRKGTADVLTLNAVRPVAVARWNTIGKAALTGMFDSWNRLVLFRAELEATSKILAVRRG
jgi:hypothetical protein